MSQERIPGHRARPKSKRLAVLKAKVADPFPTKQGGVDARSVVAKADATRARSKHNKRTALMGRKLAADPFVKKHPDSRSVKLTESIVGKPLVIRAKLTEPEVEQGSYHSPKSQILTIYSRMGHLLGEHIETQMDLVKIVGAGLPSTALERLINEVDVDVRLIGPETTVRRRMQQKQPFTVDESERLVRLARVTSMAQELFGNSEAAAQWLHAPSNYLSESAAVSPLELSQTESGARLVEAMMLQTAHGIF